MAAKAGVVAAKARGVVVKAMVVVARVATAEAGAARADRDCPGPEVAGSAGPAVVAAKRGAGDVECGRQGWR